MAEGRRSTPTWILVLQFIVALAVIAFLLAGPETLSAVEQWVRSTLLHSILPSPDPPQPPSTSAEASVRVPAQATGMPAAAAPARAVSSVSKTSAPDSEKAVPRPSRPARTASAVPPTPAPRVLEGPTPARTPAAAATRRRLQSPEPVPTAAAPPSKAEAAQPPLSPQKYFERVMRDGHELYQAGWYGPAMARFKEAARANPASASAHLWWGRAAIKIGRPAEARAALERAIVLAPDSAAAREARTLLAMLAARPQDVDR